LFSKNGYFVSQRRIVRSVELIGPSLFRGLNRYFLGMLTENRVTASLRVDALTQVLLDLNQYNSCLCDTLHRYITVPLAK